MSNATKSQGGTELPHGNSLSQSHAKDEVANNASFSGTGRQNRLCLRACLLEMTE